MKKYHDGGMLNCGKNNYANLPQEVAHKVYPKSSYGVDGPYVDSRDGIDMRASKTVSKIKSQLKKG